jgi:hypothetical protein
LAFLFLQMMAVASFAGRFLVASTTQAATVAKATKLAYSHPARN